MTEQLDFHELEPCPFCGHAALLEHDTDHHGGWFNLGCGATWNMDDPCPGYHAFYTCDPAEERAAIAAWNRRAATRDDPRALSAEADAAKVREPTMFWDADDWENGGADPADVVGNYAPGEVVKMDTAISGPTRWGVMTDRHEVKVFATADEAEAWFAAQTKEHQDG